MAKVTLTPEQRRERLDTAGRELSAAVESIVTGDDWQRALAFAGRFHHYSANNVFLLMMQCSGRGYSDVQHVAGFRTWLSLDRHVRKGEKGLAILAPCTYKTTDETTGEETYRLRGFKVEHVFADCQTDGDGEIPSMPRPELLTGDTVAGLSDALARLVAEQGFGLETTPLAEANGRTNYGARMVTISDQLAPAAAVKTLAHELAHVLLHEHRMGSDRGQVECEAESVAYLVLDAFGIASDGYSFPYVAGWSGGKAETVAKALDAAKRCAAEILASVQETAIAA
ncbi:MAG: ArdC-like ssDNA-binding domain-containing protein [Acidimicrobiales bacterium]